MSRLSKTFEQNAESVAEAVEAGAGIVDAARGADCQPRTVERWLQRGREDPEGPYGTFTARVDAAREMQRLPGPEEAKIMSRTELLAVISRAARRGSVPAMKLLAEQLDPEPSKPSRVDELKARRAARRNARRSGA
jgi:transposase-like protein